MADSDIYIAGVGMTPFGRHPGLSVKALTAWAVRDALEDAGCEAGAVGTVFFGNTAQGFFEGQHVIRGQVALLPLGLTGIPIHNVESACATGSTAFHLAVQTLRAGAAEIVLAVGAEKLHIPDKARMLALFEGGWDVATARENAARLTALGQGVELPPGVVATAAHSRFMDVYAAFGRQLMRRHGLTARQIACVAAKNHTHSVHNERAQYRHAMGTDEVLAAPGVVWPLTLPMCSPISDGAAAVLLCTGAALARMRRHAAPVRVRASVMRSASARDSEALEHHVTRLAAQAAYEAAGVAPGDIDVAEVHDATAVGEIIQSENLGFCEPGAGGRFAESGASSLGGTLPVNPSGGLESKGHPIAATGLGQIFELVQQLRHACGARQVAAARLAMQENGGGLWGVEEAAAHVCIFERV